MNVNRLGKGNLISPVFKQTTAVTHLRLCACPESLPRDCAWGPLVPMPPCNLSRQLLGATPRVSLSVTRTKPVKQLVLDNDWITPYAHGNAVLTQCNYLGLGLSVFSSRVKNLFLR